MNKLIRLILSLVLLTSCLTTLTTFAQKKEEPQTSITKENDESAVKSTIESFLLALGTGDLEKVKTILLPNANIASISMTNGVSKIFTITADEYLSKREGKRKFKEPVRKFSVNISQGMLAFVRADATVYYEDIAEYHTNDFFILMKDNGVWKILSGSFTTEPLAKN